MTDTRADVNGSVWPEVRLERLLLGLLALALLFALTLLCRGLFKPLVDSYDARQTQTALTTFWLMQGGPIFAYETPVVGYPWSIPLEFPVYQIVVASVSGAGIPLDAAGRIVRVGKPHRGGSEWQVAATRRVKTPKEGVI